MRSYRIIVQIYNLLSLQPHFSSERGIFRRKNFDCILFCSEPSKT